MTTPASSRPPLGEPAHILLVGHCRPDAFHLKTVVERAVPGAIVSMANSSEQLGASSAHLWLVNRALDGDFGVPTGIDLIRENANAPGRPALMLISNFPEAQAEAEAAGALPGFGKSSAYSTESTNRLRRAVGLPTQD